MPEIRIGTSGWSYDHWIDLVYPKGTPLRDRLEWYIKRFDTVEVNATYYRWPADTVFAGWRERLPEGFVFTVKAPKWLTHTARLENPEEWVDRIKRSLNELGEKRGIFLAQLPPSMTIDLERLDHFLELVAPWQWVAMEFRNPTWETEEVYQMLEKHNAAYCIMSGAKLACNLRATAKFVYVRLHGPDTKHLYAGSYSDDDMRWWADRMLEWKAQGRDVYAYFNNDYYGYAVHNAETLRGFTGR